MIIFGTVTVPLRGAALLAAVKRPVANFFRLLDDEHNLKNHISQGTLLYRYGSINSSFD